MNCCELHDDREAEACGMDQMFRTIAERIVLKGLGAPAILFLEMHRPLSGLLYNLSLLSSPVLSALFGPRAESYTRKIFESPDNFDRLIRMIEDMENRG